MYMYAYMSIYLLHWVWKVVCELLSKGTSYKILKKNSFNYHSYYLNDFKQNNNNNNNNQNKINKINTAACEMIVFSHSWYCLKKQKQLLEKSLESEHCCPGLTIRQEKVFDIGLAVSNNDSHMFVPLEQSCRIFHNLPCLTIMLIPFGSLPGNCDHSKRSDARADHWSSLLVQLPRYWFKYFWSLWFHVNVFSGSLIVVCIPVENFASTFLCCPFRAQASCQSVLLSRVPHL